MRVNFYMIFCLFALSCAPESHNQSAVSEAQADSKLSICAEISARHALAAAILSDSFGEINPVTNQYGVERVKQLEDNGEEQLYAVRIKTSGSQESLSANYVVSVKPAEGKCSFDSQRLASLAESDRYFGPDASYTQGRRKDGKQGVGR